jgi:hypothetical protein
MISNLSTEELNNRIEELDREFAQEGLPLKYRPGECLKLIFGHVPDGTLRQKLFESIYVWYSAKYGAQAQWDGVLGRIPVLIQGQLFLSAIYFRIEDTIRDYRDSIEELPESLFNSMGFKEFEDISEKQAIASLSFNAIYTLRNDDHRFSQKERDLIRRAQFDLDNAPFSLKNNQDTQTAIFQSKEAAEKFLKVALLRSGSKKSPEDFKHRIQALFNEVVACAPRYRWLKKPIASIQQNAPDMTVRYKTVPTTTPSAISTFTSALHVCGVLAQMWNFDHERGSERAEFQAGKFYRNHAGLFHWCKSVVGEQATLLMFEQTYFRGIGVKEAKMSVEQSPMFIQIGDRRLEESLRARLLSLLAGAEANSGRTEKIQQVRGKEGSYIVGISRTKTP